MSDHPQSSAAYEQLTRYLRDARSALLRRLATRGAMAWGAVCLAALAAATLALVLIPGGWTPVVAAVALAVAVVVGLAWLVLRPLFGAPSLAAYTRAVDEWLQAHSQEGGAFLAALELGAKPVRVGTSTQLAEAAVRERLDAVAAVDLEAPARAPLRRAYWWTAGLGALGLVTMWTLAPSRSAQALRALVNPTPPAPGVVVVQSLTGDVEVERGRPVEVVASVRGASSARTQLEVRRGAGVWRAVPMQPVSTAELPDAIRDGKAASHPGAHFFAQRIESVDQSATYRIVAEEGVSAEHRIDVLEPLRVTEIRADYAYPTYAGLDGESLVLDEGLIAALPGTRVTLRAQFNQPVESGVCQVLAGDLVSMQRDGDNVLTAELTVMQEAAYQLEVESTKRNVFGPFVIRPTADREPLVAMLEPAGDSDVPRDMTVGLKVHAADDFGLSSLHLHYSYEGGVEHAEQLARFTGYPRESTDTYDFELGELNLLPGDVVSYYLEVFDNDTVLGPKSARTPTYTLRFPTMAELYAEVEEVHEQGSEEIFDALERSEDLKDTLEDIAREMKKFPEATFEDRQEMERAFKKQEALREKISEVADSLGDALERLENQELVNEEVVEKLAEVQRLMEEITDPDLQEAMRKLRESMAQMDQNQIQRAMSDLELTQDELLRNLEKSLELLRQVQLEEQLERAVKMAEALLEEQDAISEELEEATEEAAAEAEGGEGEEGEDAEDGEGDEGEEGDDQEGDDADSEEADAEDPDASESDAAAQEESPEGEQSPESDASSPSEDDLMRLAQRQEEAMAELEKLREALQELADEMAEQQEPMAEEMQETAESAAEDEEAAQEMQQTLQQMAQNQMSQAQKSSQKASGKLSEMLNNLQLMQQSMMNQQSLEAAEKLREAADKLLWISHQEEGMLLESERPPRELAEWQSRLLDGTRTVNELLEEVVGSSHLVDTDFAGALGRPMRLMENATRSFERGSRSSGRLHGYQALAQVNETVAKLLEEEESMCSAAGSSGSPKQTMQQLMQMSQQQSQLNQESRAMMQQRGQRMSESGAQRMARMAAEQRAIQDGLQKLAESFDTRREALGRLGDLAKEMEEVVEEFERQNVDKRVLEKQQRFLTRLLDAQRSIRKRDTGRQRKSRAGRVFEARQPAPLTEEMLSREERLEADILRGRSDTYPADYREWVERYFRALAQEPAGDEVDDSIQ